MEETMEFIEKTDPDQFFVSNFVPYPGTDVWNHPEKYGVTHINKDFSNYFQVDETGFGSRNIIEKGLTNEEFLILEKEFRTWIGKRKRKGDVLDYKKELDAKFKNK